MSPTWKNPAFFAPSNVAGGVAGTLREGVTCWFEDSQIISVASLRRLIWISVRELRVPQKAEKDRRAA